jgi:NAD-dependent dihydropyrimidine dehydrogenase PreA subunit
VNALLLTPAVLSTLVLGAHFLREMSQGPVLACLAMLGLLGWRRRWVSRVYQVFLVGGGMLWVQTAVVLYQERQAAGAPAGLMLAILGGVAVVTALSALVFESGHMQRRYSEGTATARQSVGAFLLAFGILVPVQLVVDPPGLLLERFLPTGGWLEMLGLAVYAAWLAQTMLDPAVSALWRRRVWRMFSAVFFGQLLLGLAGFDRFLMTGTLHLPVPAMIVAGPLYRGSGFFMPILFTATVILVGPAWCSHLCYIGAWDDIAARGLRLVGRGGAAKTGSRRPAAMPAWRLTLQTSILLGTVVALGMRLAGVPWPVALGVGVAFGLVGVAVMVTWSRRTGAMTHCTAYCPIGVLSTVMGRINPLRIRIGEGCNECGACALPCRYDALKSEDIARRRPASSCTLCGDCVGRCRDAQIGYRFPGLQPLQARALFIVMVVGLHAAFLGAARI